MNTIIFRIPKLFSAKIFLSVFITGCVQPINLGLMESSKSSSVQEFYVGNYKMKVQVIPKADDYEYVCSLFIINKNDGTPMKNVVTILVLKSIHIIRNFTVDIGMIRNILRVGWNHFMIRQRLDMIININLRALGVYLMIFGFIICISAQFYMSSSWRIGIEINSKVKIVTGGIFKFSRNPFFLGTFFSYLGFFLVLPNILSFAVGTVYYFLIQIQVRLEEENLIQTSGSTYQDYSEKTRRWI